MHFVAFTCPPHEVVVGTPTAEFNMPEAHTHAALKQYQALDLDSKIAMTKARVRQWYEHWDGEVYVAFSGGKDSTVLRHIVLSMYPDVPCVFSDTGLEFPEIKEFVRSLDGVVWVRPKMTYRQVVDKHGYAVVSKVVAGAIDKTRRLGKDSKSGVYYTTGMTSTGKFSKMAIIPKRWMFLTEDDAPFKVSPKCCDILKKEPFKRYQKETGRMPISGDMVAESMQRRTTWLASGCNMYGAKAPRSTPMAFWKEEDVWEYIRRFNVPYSSIYDMGYDRTGCIWCAFGVHREKGENRFQKLKRTHPQIHSYCMDKMGLREVMAAIGVEVEPAPDPATAPLALMREWLSKIK